MHYRLASIIVLLTAISACNMPDWRPPAPLPIPVPTVIPTPTPTPTPTPAPSSEFPPNLIWLHPNISAWPITTHLAASVRSSRSSPSNFTCKVTLSYAAARTWPAIANVSANPWIIVQHRGQWYAATWEWLRPNATLKDMDNKSWAAHIKRGPLADFEPQPGQIIGLMVSGLIRDSKRNVAERSNISWLVWPDGYVANGQDTIPSFAGLFPYFADPVTETTPDPVIQEDPSCAH